MNICHSQSKARYQFPISSSRRSWKPSTLRRKNIENVIWISFGAKQNCTETEATVVAGDGDRDGFDVVVAGGGDAAVVIGGRGDGSDIVVAISEMVLTLSLLEVTS